MYQVLVENSVIGLCESPYYIKKKQNGIIIETNESDATGIVFDNSVYNLIGHNDFPEKSFANVHEIDSGEYVFGTHKNIIEIETALCELDSIINGGANNE